MFSKDRVLKWLRYSGVLAALLPVLPLVATLRSHRNPDPRTTSAVALEGSWKHFDGAVAGGAAADLDDSTWGEVALPGIPNNTAGVHEEWARRWVDLPTSQTNQNWVLVMGGSRSGILSVYVNGQLIGSDGIRPGMSRTSFFSSESFTVPQALLQPGRNLVALHWDVGDDNYFGFVSRMFYLAPASLARPGFARVAALENFLQSGPPFLFLFLVILVLAMLIYEWDTGDRPRYFATLGFILAPTLLLLNSTGVVFSAFLDSSDRLAAQLYLMLGITFTAPEFLCQYFSTAPRYRRINRYVVGIILLIAIAVSTIDRSYFFAFYALVAAPYALVTLITGGVIAVRGAFRLRTASSVTLSSALVVLLLTMFLDVLTDVGVMHLPRVFINSVGMLPVVVGLIVLSDFIRLSVSNKELMASLNQRNAALATALSAANESMRMKNQFLATVSHELRTPLNPIINLPEGLLEDFPPKPDGGREFSGNADKTAGHLASIATAGRSLLGLVEQVLDMSRLQAGQALIDARPMKLSALLGEVRQKIEPAAAARRVTLSFDAPADVEFDADAEKLSQVLLCLVSNAVKFSPEGGPVSITAKREDTTLRFSVRDQGIGIATADHQRIFEAFSQLDGGHTRKFGGAGLGLAIARQLTELHGGRLWVESEPGKGSTFHVALPLTVSLVAAA